MPSGKHSGLENIWWRETLVPPPAFAMLVTPSTVTRTPLRGTGGGNGARVCKHHLTTAPPYTSSSPASSIPSFVFSFSIYLSLPPASPSFLFPFFFLTSYGFNYSFFFKTMLPP
ncbi:hypothetical protein E2C01_002539 [Portunus trituberculatus]|uniref:Uncharacterized protein n=1 Tax=Portunus trituberculatus TaxID=210409 RepID=A0A5B7CK68_PORTR|nr:hypothetical protein [Portunus trituberculatus]